MKRCLVFALSFLAATSPARADFNAHYRGVDRFTGEDSTAVVQISVSKDRVAFVIQGSRSLRILYWKDRGRLRLVDDTENTYMDMDSCANAGGGLLSTVEGQLSQLSPEQRAIAEQMIQGSINEESNAPKTEFVRTKETKKVFGHDCTMVKIQMDGETYAEYCACTSPDFKLSGAERAAISEADHCIHNLFTIAKPAKGDPSSAFEWDTGTDDFPLLTRCLDGEAVTLEVTLESFDRTKIADSLFAVPAAYTKVNPAEADSTGE